MAVIERRYVPDVTAMMAECEANYARLMKLVPDLATMATRYLGMTYPSGVTVDVEFERLEHFRYTSTVHIRQCAGPARWLDLPSMVVRLYHDARMAEVVQAQHMRQLKGIYQYPNAAMQQMDEKMQRNLYLGEWLCYCQQHGHVAEPLSLADS